MPELMWYLIGMWLVTGTVLHVAQLVVTLRLQYTRRRLNDEMAEILKSSAAAVICSHQDGGLDA